MFPSFDSWSNEVLLDHQASVTKFMLWGGVIYSIITVLFGSYVGVYNHLLGNEIESRPASQPATDTGSVGAIKPGSGPTPELPRPAIDRGIRQGEFAIFTGTSVVIANSFPITAIAHNDEDIISLDRDLNGMLINCIFFNEEGQVICQVEKNEIYPNFKNMFRLDAISESHVAVISDEGHRIIEVEWLNEQAVRIKGNFYIRNGLRLRITEELIETPRSTIKGVIGAGLAPGSIGIHFTDGEAKRPAAIELGAM